jgi:hypothetical protein
VGKRITPEESPPDFYVIVFYGDLPYKGAELVDSATTCTHHSNLRVLIEKRNLTFKSGGQRNVVMILKRDVFAACNGNTIIERFGDAQVPLVADKSYSVVFEFSQNLGSTIG